MFHLNQKLTLFCVLSLANSLISTKFEQMSAAKQLSCIIEIKVSILNAFYGYPKIMFSDFHQFFVLQLNINAIKFSHFN